jgi:hypothetical protein
MNEAAIYLPVHKSRVVLFQKGFSLVFLLVAIGTNHQSNLLVSSIRLQGLPLNVKHQTFSWVGWGKGNMFLFSICRF